MAKSSDLHHSRRKRKDTPQSAGHAFGTRNLSRRHCKEYCQRKTCTCAFIRGIDKLAGTDVIYKLTSLFTKVYVPTIIDT